MTANKDGHGRSWGKGAELTIKGVLEMTYVHLNVNLADCSTISSPKLLPKLIPNGRLQGYEERCREPQIDVPSASMHLVAMTRRYISN